MASKQMLARLHERRAAGEPYRDAATGRGDHSLARSIQIGINRYARLIDLANTGATDQEIEAAWSATGVAARAEMSGKAPPKTMNVDRVQLEFMQAVVDAAREWRDASDRLNELLDDDEMDSGEMFSRSLARFHEGNVGLKQAVDAYLTSKEAADAKPG